MKSSTRPITRYGREWPAQMPDWAIELFCFLHQGKISKSTGVKLVPEPRHKAEHFINAANCFWGHKKSSSRFIWHPWAEDMLYAACEHKYVGLAGSGSCGKSRFMAVWCILNWMAAPKHTLCLLTSTTIRESKQRVWGAVADYFQSGPASLGIGKIISTPTPAIHAIIDGVRKEDAGLQLVPGDAKKSAEVTSKVRGIKQSRVILAADELSELSHALLETAMSNLVNNDDFSLIGAANPNSYLDPFGMFVEPLGGWKSICAEDESWPMKRGGICLHFDALKNPNFVAKENIWPIQKWEKVQEALNKPDAQTSPGFWRDYRAFWCPTGMDSSIYSEVEIINNDGDKPAEWSGRRKIPIAGFDPNYSGGDRAILYTGFYGDNPDGVEQIEFGEYFEINEDVTNKQVSASVQKARRILDILREKGIALNNLAIDATAGGSIFCDVLANEAQSDRFLRVRFNEAATDRPVSTLDPTPAKDLYRNRVTEIWCVGVEFLRAGQLRGIGTELMREMTERRYQTTRASGSVTKMVVEPKVNMKARTQRSPDIADAAFVMLDLVRERYSIRSNDGRAINGGPNNRGKMWRKALSGLTKRSRPVNLRR